MRRSGRKRRALGVVVRRLVYERDGFTCQICGVETLDPRLAGRERVMGGRTVRVLTQSEVDRIREVDHVVPLARGGTDELENLQVACHRCNRLKGDS